jgi:hypothetical protein
MRDEAGDTMTEEDVRHAVKELTSALSSLCDTVLVILLHVAFDDSRPDEERVGGGEHV